MKPPESDCVKICKSKKRHPDRYVAEAARDIHCAIHSISTPLCVYQCDVCRGWHLTKKIHFKDCS